MWSMWCHAHCNWMLVLLWNWEGNSQESREYYWNWLYNPAWWIWLCLPQCLGASGSVLQLCSRSWWLWCSYFPTWVSWLQRVCVGDWYHHTNRRYRFTAYRQLTRWCWGWLGREIRVVLPSCAVKKIRNTFPSSSYTGFSLPSTTMTWL